ncbi:hypothetical protein GT347_16105 [Xylophilus rhododendri]|uniref:Uncharacterized protein n=1 Tax=Xylophilus rhododendri TaxID=2697032 RepID=A0A857J6N6_9BURK|nr:hypothetical protein [Xylophilus rhododendri]QHI99367.1 hypothetical protein GT347_16105 [Xylophilus rhododendri]
MNPSWPRAVRLSLAGAQQQDASVIERSDMERGPAKTRRAATDPMVTVSATALFLASRDVAAFRAWLYSPTGADAGAAWVDWTDPRTGAVRSIRIVSLGALTPIASCFAIAQQPVVFEYLETVEEIAAGVPLRWDFTANADGWIAYPGLGTLTWAPGKITAAAEPGRYPVIRRPDLQISGAYQSVVRMAITRLAGSGWTGNLYYQTQGRPFDSGGFRKQIANPVPAVGASAVVTWDMAQLTAGGADWLQNTITSLSVDFGAAADDVFEIDWIEVAAA